MSVVDSQEELDPLGAEPRQEPIESFRTTPPEDDEPTSLAKRRIAPDQPPAVH